VEDKSRWRNQFQIGPKEVANLSKNRKAAEWSPHIKRYISNPLFMHDAIGKELSYPWAGQISYEFYPLDLIALRSLTRVFGYMFMFVQKKQAPTKKGKRRRSISYSLLREARLFRGTNEILGELDHMRHCQSHYEEAYSTACLVRVNPTVNRNLLSYTL